MGCPAPVLASAESQVEPRAELRYLPQRQPSRRPSAAHRQDPATRCRGAGAPPITHTARLPGEAAPRPALQPWGSPCTRRPCCIQEPFCCYTPEGYLHPPGSGPSSCTAAAAEVDRPVVKQARWAGKRLVSPACLQAAQLHQAFLAGRSLQPAAPKLLPPLPLTSPFAAQGSQWRQMWPAHRMTSQGGSGRRVLHSRFRRCPAG